MRATEATPIGTNSTEQTASQAVVLTSTSRSCSAMSEMLISRIVHTPSPCLVIVGGFSLRYLVHLRRKTERLHVTVA